MEEETQEDKDKRYLAMGWDRYYPSGGLGNVLDSFDNIPDAIKCLNECEDDFVCLSFSSPVFREATKSNPIHVPVQLFPRSSSSKEQTQRCGNTLQITISHGNYYYM